MSEGKRIKPMFIFKGIFFLSLAGTLFGSLVLGGVLFYYTKTLPAIITVADYKPLGVTRVLGSGGVESDLLAEFYTERRYLVSVDKIPEVVINAFISAEDDKFYEHQGFNLSSMLRAFFANLKAGHVVQGGSTITQQVAKSLLLTPERSLSRKAKELILANRIESNLSKKEILYLYLNQIYLGHGAYGVQAAALSYFKKDVMNLTLAEAAILAGLPQAPSLYSPLIKSQKSKERQKYVLRRMYENKFITETQMANAEGEAIRIYERDTTDTVAPHLVEHLRRYIEDKYGEKALYQEGLTIATPVSGLLSKVASRSLQEGLRMVDQRHGYRGPIKRLNSDQEITKELQEQRLSMIRRNLGFVMFLPDGRIDPIDSIRAANYTSESQLLELDKLYPAVVTQVDDQTKKVYAFCGSIRVEIPADLMSWANPNKARPSEILKKGDLIEVKITKIQNGAAVASLEQDPNVEGAILSIEARTGAILAMEGGYDFDQSKFNRAVQAFRQPGSAYKPIIYGAAIEKGFTPVSIIVDAPIVYEDADSGKWKPANYEEKFYGDTTLRQALIKSRNVPTIKLVQAVTVPYLIDFSKRLGMTSALAPDLSIALGSSTSTLLELVKAYAVFPRLGKKVEPVFVSWIKDRNGIDLERTKLSEWQPTDSQVSTQSASEETVPSAASTEGKLDFSPKGSDPNQVLDPRVAYVMTHLMNEVVSYGTGYEAKNLGRATAGKTGTTNDFIDAWFMGFTPSVVTGVWVGNDSQKPIGPSETGARAALPIWLSFMKEAVKGYPDVDFTIPPGVVFASIDPTSGKLAPSHSSRSIKEVFIEGTAPTLTGAKNFSGADSQSEFLKGDIE